MNSFVLKVTGETRMSPEALEAALHNFLLQHELLQSESGVVYEVYFNDVSVLEYEEGE